MRISVIKLNGVEHTLAIPIDVIEEDYINSNGERMIKIYNTIFGLLGYCTDTEISRNCFKEEINLIINSYLFDPEYLHDKPMLNECLVLRNTIIKHVYGDSK